MKTTEEILNQLETSFINNKDTMIFWNDLAEQEESVKHHKRANEYQAVADSYSSKNSEIAKMYSYIKEIGIYDAFKELHKKYKIFKNRESFVKAIIKGDK